MWLTFICLSRNGSHFGVITAACGGNNASVQQAVREIVFDDGLPFVHFDPHCSDY